VGNSLRIVDVGARFGLHPSFVPIQDNSDILLVDADPFESERLSHKYKQHPNIRVKNAFVSHGNAVDSKRRLNIYSHPGGSSAFEPRLDLPYWSILRPGSATIQDAVDVASASLDELCTPSACVVDFLKIDVEGAELEVLRGATRTLASIIGVRIEVMFNSLYQDLEPNFGNLDALLRANGLWLLRYDLPTNAYAPFSRFRGSDSYGMIVGGDAIYIRDMTDVEGTATTIVFKMALFAALNKAIDLSLYLLLKICGRSDYLTDQCVIDLMPTVERLVATEVFRNQDLPGQSLVEFAPVWEKLFTSEPLKYGDYFRRYH